LRTEFAFCLAFSADPRSDGSSCASQARKGYGNQHDQRRSQYSRERCGTGRHSRAGASLLNETRHPEDGRAQGKKKAKGGKARPAAPKKSAKTSKKAGKGKAAKATTPRAESKGAKISP